MPSRDRNWPLSKPEVVELLRPGLFGIAGGSGCGKSYLVRHIQNAVGKNVVSVIGMDQYFRSETHGDASNVNFDHPAHLDFDLLLKHLTSLKEGQTVRVPSYDFLTMIQTPDAIEVKPTPIIIVEGLFVLAEPMRRLFDLTCFLDVEVDQRLLGRILRDQHERKATIDETIERYQRFVRPSYRIFVEPTRQEADIVVDFTYRRSLFATMLVELMRDYVRGGFDFEKFVGSVREDTYRIGYSAHDPVMPLSVDIRELAKAYPEQILPEVWDRPYRRTGTNGMAEPLATSEGLGIT